MFSFEYRQRTQTARLIFLGVFVHLILFVGVMDIFFSSPVQRGLPSHKANGVVLAKRVIVFVADGLRAEAIYEENNLKYIPFLTGIRNGIGASGVAHTRVPTESRPGHVAIFAGMYEDPSAVMKGWKHNPIDFDHVFNQSDHSWLWGSPDVIPMFNKDNLNKIYTDCYEPSFEDFSGQQSTILLDDWVFHKVKNFFPNKPARKCLGKCRDLLGGRNIFFLHLLGMDTAGHVYKPNSVKYFDNLKFVDKGIKEIVEMIDHFYDDNQTTYIFTSDHGMTDWGSHGSGSEYETEAPFIIWGAGVKQNSERQDLRQADITPIISVLLGINIPINSMGIFKENYFVLSDEEIANISLANSLTLSEHYKSQQFKMQRNFISFFYEPYEGLTAEHCDQHAESIKQDISVGKFQEAISKTRQFIYLIQKGMVYNNRYLQLPMLICLAIGLVLFMIYVSATIPKLQKENAYNEFISENVLKGILLKFAIIISFIFFTLILKGVEKTYCLYIIFPHILILALIYDINQLMYMMSVVYRYKAIKLIFTICLILVGIQCLVMTFFHRNFIMYAVAGVVSWIFIANVNYMLSIDKIIWSVVTIGLPMFPFFSSYYKELNYVMAAIGAVMAMVLLITSVSNILSSFRTARRPLNYFSLLIISIQFFCILFASVNVIWMSYFDTTSGFIMNYIYITSWIILVLCLTTMTLHPREIKLRCIGIQISLYNIYYMMSFNGEAIFLAAFVYICTTWANIEMDKFVISKDKQVRKFADKAVVTPRVSLDDFRRCYCFMTFILMSFFGSGNISDLNTFDPMWTRCFVKVFSPHLIMVLIGLRLLIPFVITTVTFQSVNVYGRIPTINCFCIILLYSDIMVLNMMFQVTNEGSWLEIGLSISRFVIVMVITLALLFLYLITKQLTENIMFDKLARHFYIILRSRFALSD